MRLVANHPRDQPSPNMEDLDLDSFIANIEQTAPEEAGEAKLSCRECGSKLEEQEDGNFTCPVCSVQATNIHQFDDTELHHDEQGRPVYGQRVLLAEKRSKHQVDYGWAWSTDEAIAHILNLQLDALEEARLVEHHRFRPALTNMWLKYWLQTVAPHIKDEYSEGELVPISTSKALKLRDIEVLVKIRDKVMVPLHLIRGRKDTKLIYNMLGTTFANRPANGMTTEIEDEHDERDDEEQDDEEQDHTDDDSISSGDDMRSSTSSLSFDYGPLNQIPEELIREFNSILANEPPKANSRSQLVSADAEKENNGDSAQNEHLDAISRFCLGRTQNLSDESITVLTLNRSLAFLEATARCLPDDDPLFASDIIRACNQYLIPFYGASKLLPETMRLNSRDKLMFQKTRPPTPNQLTRAASLLINNIYKDEFPKTLPTPDLNSLLQRFIKDINLPRDLFQMIKDKVNFNTFRATRPLKFTKKTSRRLPQYDRWAFAVLLYHLKTLFHLGDQHIQDQKKLVIELSKGQPGKYFIMSDWLEQISSRLELILRFDPFVLYHPLSNLYKLEVSAQLSKYVERLIEARASVEIRAKPEHHRSSQAFRTEMAEFLRRELPGPRDIKRELQSKEEFMIPKSIKYPLTDAFERTQDFWLAQSSQDSAAHDLISEDFSSLKIVTLPQLPRWSVYDNEVDLDCKSLEISPFWPPAFRLLLRVGAFLCFCEPVELVNEFRLVEEFLQPHTKVIKQITRNKSKMRWRRLEEGSARNGRTYSRRGREPRVDEVDQGD